MNFDGSYQNSGCKLDTTEDDSKLMDTLTSEALATTSALDGITAIILLPCTISRTPGQPCYKGKGQGCQVLQDRQDRTGQQDRKRMHKFKLSIDGQAGVYIAQERDSNRVSISKESQCLFLKRVKPWRKGVAEERDRDAKLVYRKGKGKGKGKGKRDKRLYNHTFT